jgi:membrane-associated phospholipid phosphatase
MINIVYLVTLFYQAIILILTLKCFSLFTFFLFIISFLLFISNPPRLVKYWAPIIFVPFSYFILSNSIHSINPNDIDAILLSIDYKIFGVYPTLWIEKFIHPLITDVLQISYISYFFLPIILLSSLYSKRKYDNFTEAMFALVLGFYLNYLCYILFPAVGPYATIHHTKELTGILFKKINTILLNLRGAHRDCFPSGHTGITLIILYFSFKYERKLFPIFTFIFILIIISTIYLRYHYVVDIIGGIILAFIVLFITNTLVFYKFSRLLK